jgi:hypothetical protein
MKTKLSLLALSCLLGQGTASLAGEPRYECRLSSDKEHTQITIGNNDKVEILFDGIHATIRMDESCPIIRLRDPKSGAQATADGGSNVNMLGAGLNLPGLSVTTLCRLEQEPLVDPVN